MRARFFAWLMRRAGTRACALDCGPVKDAVSRIAATHQWKTALPVVVFESPVLEGFVWQFSGLRVLGLSSGLVRRFMRRAGDCPEFYHIIRHELEHCLRRHWLAGACGNALAMAGAGIMRAGERIIAALEQEADGYE